MTIRDPSRAPPPTCQRSVDDRSIEVGPGSEDLKARTDAVVAIAAENVASVDRDARFPEEAITAVRAQRLLVSWSPRVSVGRALGSPTSSMSAMRSVGHVPLQP